MFIFSCADTFVKSSAYFFYWVLCLFLNKVTCWLYAPRQECDISLTSLNSLPFSSFISQLHLRPNITHLNPSTLSPGSDKHFSLYLTSLWPRCRSVSIPSQRHCSYLQTDTCPPNPHAPVLGCMPALTQPQGSFMTVSSERTRVYVWR